MRVRLGIAVVVLSAVAAAGAATARAGTALIVTGHGWGHGVGMSQWGAYGYARHGWKYRRILSHYYPGTTMGHVGELRVRVLLAQAASSVTVGCATNMTVTDGKRLTRTLKAGTYGVGPRLVLPVKRKGQGLSFGHLAVFSCARAPLTYDGREYHGTLALRSQSGRVAVVNGLSLDTYLRGVVPSESPARWPIAALEAQAVAARSYAVFQLKPSSWYDLVPTTADQVYGGVAAERPRSDHAVYATLGQVLNYGGAIARTYYSASSGGRTEAVQDAWPGTAPIPYLRSVPDPYDSYSPHHDWGPFDHTPSRLAAQLGLGSAVESVHVRRDGKRARPSLSSSGWPRGRGDAQRSRRRPGAASTVGLVLDRRAAAVGEQQPGAVRQQRHRDRARRAREGRRARRAEPGRRVADRPSPFAAGAAAAPAPREHHLPPRRAGDEGNVGVGRRRAAGAGACVEPAGARRRDLAEPRRRCHRLASRARPNGASSHIRFSTRAGSSGRRSRSGPVEYRVAVAAGKLAAAQTSLHVTRRLLQSLRSQ